MTDDARRNRIVLIGIIATVLLIGIVGVTIALNSSSDNTAGTTTQPGAPLDPLSVQGVCGTAHVASYTVAAVGKRPIRGLTVTAAVQPWLLRDESSQTTTVNASTSRAALGRPGAPAREVLSLAKDGTGWRITTTTACLTQNLSVLTCPDQGVLTVAGKAYVEEATGDGYAPSVVVGQGSVRPCVQGDQKTFFARGSIAPATAYRAKAKGHVVLELGGGSYTQYGPKQ